MMNVPSEPAVTEHFDMMRLCKQHEKEIRTLRQELAMHDTLTNRSQISYEPLSESQIQDVREQVKRFLAGEMNDIELVNVRQIKETFAQFRVIVNTMKADVEEKLREKYVLQERDGTTSGELLSYSQGGWGRYSGQFLLGAVPQAVRATHPITITVYSVANPDPILNAFGQMKQLYNCESSQFFKSLFLPKFYDLQNLDYVRPHSSNSSVNTTHL